MSIKKMWGVFGENEIIKCCALKEDAEIENKKYGEEEFPVKPVWVTDRDPFENSRKWFKCENDYETIPKTALELDIAKDLKNWDEEKNDKNTRP